MISADLMPDSSSHTKFEAIPANFSSVIEVSDYSQVLLIGLVPFCCINCLLSSKFEDFYCFIIDAPNVLSLLSLSERRGCCVSGSFKAAATISGLSTTECDFSPGFVCAAFEFGLPLIDDTMAN